MVPRGLSARMRAGRRACGRRTSPGAGIGVWKCRAARACRFCVGDHVSRAVRAIVGLWHGAGGEAVQGDAWSCSARQRC
eukprot:1723983-Pyramimonas_sp.AAC.1